MANTTIYHEYQQKYKGCFFLWEDDETNESFPICLNDVVDFDGNLNNPKLIFTAWNNKGAFSKEDVFNNLKLDVAPVVPKLVNFQSSTYTNAFFVGKTAKRQFRRAFNSDLYTIISMDCFYREDLHSFPGDIQFVGSSSRLSFSKMHSIAIRDVFFPYYYDFNNAINQILGNTKESVALSSKWGMGLSFEKSYDFVLYRETLPVGEMQKKNNTIKILIEEYYQQEFVDFIRRKGIVNVELQVRKEG